jgi:hypothetical protein
MMSYMLAFSPAVRPYLPSILPAPNDCWLKASVVRHPENEMQGTEDDESGGTL